MGENELTESRENSGTYILLFQISTLPIGESCVKFGAVAKTVRLIFARMQD